MMAFPLRLLAHGSFLTMGADVFGIWCFGLLPTHLIVSYPWLSGIVQWGSMST